MSNKNVQLRINLDGKQLNEEVKRSRRAMQQLGNDVVNESRRMESAFTGIGRKAAVIAGAWSLKELATDVVRVRGEMQRMETTMKTLVGNKVAGELIPQIKELGKISPLTVSDLIEAEQTMLGFNVATDKTIGYLKALSDVSMGNADRFRSLTLAFSQVQSAEKLMGQDLLQMINAGFNPLQQISERTGRSLAQLKEEMADGAITADMVAQAFIDATSEGGKFYNMSANASKMIEGRLSMMEDALDTALNKIGEESEGVIMGSIDMATMLIENYEAVGDAVLGVVAVYGSYRAALLLTMAAEKLAAAQRLASIRGMGTQQQLLGRLTTAWRTLASAKNAYVMIGAAAIYGAVKLATAMNAEEAATAAVSLRMENLTAAQQSRTNKVNDYIATIKDETKTAAQQREAYNALLNILPGLKEGYSIAEVKTMELAEAQRILNESFEAEKLVRMREEVERYNAVIDGSRWEKLASAWEDMDFWEFAKATKAWSVLLNPTFGGIQMLLSGDLDDAAEAGKAAAETQLRGYEEEMAQAEWDKLSLEDKIKTRAAEVVEIDTRIKLKSTEIENLDAVIEDLQRQLNTISLTLTPEQRGILTMQLGAALNRRKELQGEVEQDTADRNAIKSEIAGYQEATNAIESVAQRRTKAYAAWQAAEKEYRNALKGDSKVTDAKIKELKDNADKAKKAYDTYVIKGAEKTAGKVAEANAKLVEVINKAAKERAMAMEDLTGKQKQNAINLGKNAEERKWEQLYHNQEQEIRQLEDERDAAIAAEKERQKSEHDAREAVAAAKHKNYTKRVFTEADTDQSQIVKIVEQYTILLDQTRRLHREAVADMSREEAGAMRGYLSEYGTYQQRRLAIAEDYAAKIAEATSKGEQLKLEAERDKALAGLNFSEIRQNIDWAGVFGGFGGMLRTELEENLRLLQELMDSEEFRLMDATDQERIVEAARNLQLELGGDLIPNFGEIGRQTEGVVEKFRALQEAQKEEEVAMNLLATAKKAAAQAEATGTATERAAAENAVKTAQKNADRLSKATTEASTAYDAASNALQTNVTTITGTLDGFASALDKLKSGSLKSAYEGTEDVLGTLSTTLTKHGSGLLKGLGNVLGDAAKAMGGATGEIISAALGVLDVLKEGIGGIISSLTDLVFDAINGILDDVFSGDIVMKPLQSVLDGVGTMLNTITFGGFKSWFGGNAKEVAETIDRLSNRNELLCIAIETLTEEIKASRGTKSVAAYREAYKLQDETNRNYLDIAKAQAGYSGSHHSWNYYWGGFTPEEIERVSKQIGRAWDGSLWSLSPEEMELLRSNVDIWERIQNTGKGGYGGRLTETLGDYIDQAGKLDELKEQLYEGLTGISFDSMYDSFIDNLMNMKYGAKDAAEDISEYFARAMVSNKVGEMMSDDLEQWWTDFGKAMEDGNLSQEERDALLEEYLGYMDEAAKIRDDIFAATGYNGGESASQDSTKRGYATASQESIDELTGRSTGIQMAVEYIKEQNGAMAVDVSGMRVDVTAIRQHADELRGLALMAVNHLADISRNTYQLHEINERLGKIEKNTRKI